MTRQFYSDPTFGVIDATTVFSDSKREIGPPKHVRLSEFIAELQEVLKDEGDLPVVDGESCESISGPPSVVVLREIEGMQDRVVI